MTPQRRTALVSVAAAAVLVALKLGTGLASGSLGLVSEALHSGTDLVAALLTFFAVGVPARPADGGTSTATARPSTSPRSRGGVARGRQRLHRLARAVAQLAGGREQTVDATWWVFAVIGVVIAIDAGRTRRLVRARAPALPQRGARVERAPLRQRPRRLARRPRRARRRAGRVRRRRLRSPRSSSPCSCSSPRRG